MSPLSFSLSTFSSRRALLTPVLALAAAALVGCGKSNAPDGLDGGCSPGCVPTTQACVNKACVTASPEGTPCGSAAPDGGPTVCITGLVCDLVANNTPVCSRDCTAPTDCPNGGSCYSRPTGSMGMGYCATPVGVGSKCDDEALQQCTAATAHELVNCVSNNGVSGVCFERCGPQETTCPTGQDCTVAFSDGLGVCAPSTDAGSPCNQAQLQFCTGGQECVVEGLNDQGICHLPCTGADGGCPTGQSCEPIDACGTAGSICVVARQQGQSCDATSDQFCDSRTDCVNLSGELLCQPDCTSGQACPTGTTCNDLPLADGGPGCRKSCF